MNNPNCGKCGMLSNTGYCKLTACIYPCQSGMGGYINKPVTNADRIRMMTDEELSIYLSTAHAEITPIIVRRQNCSKKGAFKWLDWLKQEAE